jgi:recombination DNA repair RAD52 pathway protein
MSNNRCAICDERSTWEFLRDFYIKVESANGYAQRMENERHEAMKVAQESQHNLAQCEASLAASWKLLNEERLQHRASQEALLFELERHQETIQLLNQVFKEAERTGEVADRLSRKLAELQAASESGVVQAVPQTTTSTVVQNILAPPEAFNFTSNSPGLKHSSTDERGSSFPIRAQTLPLIESESRTSGAGGKGTDSKRSKPRPVTKKRKGIEES